jgi:hypothetical protein
MGAGVADGKRNPVQRPVWRFVAQIVIAVAVATAVSQIIQAGASDPARTLEVALPAIVGAVVSLLVLGLAGGALYLIWRVFTPRQSAPLTAAERAYIDDALAQVTAYGDANGFAPYEWLRWVQLALFFILMLSGFAGIILGYRYLADAAAMARQPADADWAIYAAEPIGVSALAAIFAWLGVMVAPVAAFNRLWPRAAEALTWIEVQAGRMPGGLEWILKAFLRSGRLSLKDPFEPGRFLRDASNAWVPIFVWPGLILTVVTAFFLALDLARYDLITPDRIVTVDYWTSKARAHRYEGVAAITLKCAKETSYGLTLRAGERVVVEFRPDDGKRLDALTIVDDRLRAQGVQVAFATREPWFRDPVTDYSADCVARFVEGQSPGRAAQIERILHLDDWRAGR